MFDKLTLKFFFYLTKWKLTKMAWKYIIKFIQQEKGRIKYQRVKNKKSQKNSTDKCMEQSGINNSKGISRNLLFVKDKTHKMLNLYFN